MKIVSSKYKPLQPEAKKDIITLAKYLITKGVDYPLRLQKLLFFLRYEELKNKTTQGSYFAKNHNFEAWIYGPVNPTTYNLLQYYFAKEDEKDRYLLDLRTMWQIDRKYKAYFDKWNKFSSSQLIVRARRNYAWIKARHDLEDHEPCTEKINEQTEDFLEFL